MRHTTAGRMLHYRIPPKRIKQETAKFENNKKKYYPTKKSNFIITNFRLLDNFLHLKIK